MDYPKLTKKQREMFNYIEKFVRDYGYSPSYREIAEHFHLNSVATVAEHIKGLQDKKFLKKDYNKARTLELIGVGMNIKAEVVDLPLMGLITAGEPIEAIEEKETMAIPADFVVDGANSYVLKVKGESMIDDGILDGDYVVVERNPSPSNGDIVVALLNNAYATLKRFYRETNRIRLQPANSAMEPIYVRDLIVQGVVRAVIRKFN